MTEIKIDDYVTVTLTDAGMERFEQECARFEEFAVVAERGLKHHLREGLDGRRLRAKQWELWSMFGWCISHGRAAMFDGNTYEWDGQRSDASATDTSDQGSEPAPWYEVARPGDVLRLVMAEGSHIWRWATVGMVHPAEVQEGGLALESVRLNDGSTLHRAIDKKVVGPWFLQIPESTARQRVQRIDGPYRIVDGVAE